MCPVIRMLSTRWPRCWSFGLRQPRRWPCSVGRVTPALAPDFETDSLGAGVTRVVLMTLGLMQQFVLAMIIIFGRDHMGT